MSHKEAGDILNKFLDFFTPDFNNLNLGAPTPTGEEISEEKNTEILEHPKEFYEQQQKPQEVTPEELSEEISLDEKDIEDMTIEDYVDEQVMQYEGPVNEWQTPYEYTTGFNPKVDSSIGAIAYLRSLGYNEALWDVHESHDEWDICDELRGEIFTLDEIIDYASVHKIVKGYAHPPAGIWAHSHPDCRCHLICYPPGTVDEIPDDAPGLPTYAEPELLHDFKFKLSYSFPIVIVTSVTQAPDYHYLHQGAALQIIERYKQAQKENWVDDIQPIKINKTTMMEIELGLVHPIVQGDIGFQLQKTDNKSKIYSYTYKRIFNIPNKYIDILSLQESNASEYVPGTFINVDGNLAIINRILDGNILCYIPEIDTLTTINNIPISIYTY